MLSTGTQFIQHSTEVRGDSMMTYCLEYDLTKFHSRWVAFRFDGLTRAKSTGRHDTWTDDPDLSPQYQIGAGTFSGGVRGHICASYDRRYSVEAEKQTYYMTNMTPMGYDFNGSYWTVFESYINDKDHGIGCSSTFADTLYVVKGGTIRDGQIKGYAHSSAWKQMPIPKYYFIALLKLKAGTYKSIGFLVEHKDYGRKATMDDVRDAAMTIDKLEQETAIDFFPNLPDDIETKVEKSYSKADWNL